VWKYVGLVCPAGLNRIWFEEKMKEAKPNLVHATFGSKSKREYKYS
jgi:hypothetical protein